MKSIALLILALTGCCGSTPAYKVANAARLAAVQPRLMKYAATTQPAEQQAVTDLLRSWAVEVKAQAQNP